MWLICKFLGLLVNAILFYNEKKHFKQKLLLWPQVPFKEINDSARAAILVPEYSSSKNVK